MTESHANFPTDADLDAGVPIDAFEDGTTLSGEVGGTRVLLARRGSEFLAVGASCTHLGGPLAKGLVSDDTVRCPWHHACFSLRTGRAIEAPAFDALPRYETEVVDGRVFVRDEIAPDTGRGIAEGEDRIVIVGGGAAGFAAADLLRREGHAGPVVILSEDADPPYDRTMLSKAFLQGAKGADDLALADPDGLAGIEIRTATRVEAIEPQEKRVRLADGSTLGYSTLLLATGGEPRRPDFPGADHEAVRVLRSLEDARGVVARLSEGAKVVVMGASFIGMEAAAALAKRGCAVTVVAPQEKPMAMVFGEAFSDMLRALHEENGVTFRLGRKVGAYEDATAILDDGARLPADLVLVGIGVTPRTALAEAAGLAVGDGVEVDATMCTSDPHVYAAGDIAAFPDPQTGERIRVEHWVVAQRQGQTAALAMMGRVAAYDDPPFFWTKQYDLSVRYVGHAPSDATMEVEGDPAARDALVRIAAEDEVRAVATAGRDRAALEASEAMRRG
ncbi:apoptosis inducing factor family protein [Salinarimonas ramus]|uniref:Pyridine nucleotide-disulfide oxidoreductase n=1 Tax=Salinarimonas ramus TaxID=690164 RepID=A0A917QE56_9HYPH|nr:apoptosis inducing factor family protein [Salinarimonas ramus]GGK46409.1 pyridine nucleotide-disulfide oxidoreductase [Salinarimonas ramus]